MMLCAQLTRNDRHDARQGKRMMEDSRRWCVASTYHWTMIAIATAGVNRNLLRVSTMFAKMFVYIDCTTRPV